MIQPTCIAEHPDYNRSIYSALNSLKLPYEYDSENDSEDEEDYEGVERDIVAEILLLVDGGEHINAGLEESMSIEYQLRMANYVMDHFCEYNPVKPVVKKWLETYTR